MKLKCGCKSWISRAHRFTFKLCAKHKGKYTEYHSKDLKIDYARLKNANTY